MRIAITGHRELPKPTERLVDEAIRGELRQYLPAQLVGISSLADGADQIFAQAVLDLGGQLDVIVPATEYRDNLPADSHDTYDTLLARAAHVRRLDHQHSDSTAHMHASEVMLADADHLIAVWDGQPARGYGGTADVVALAHDQGIKVTVVWPAGARRDASAVA